MGSGIDYYTGWSQTELEAELRTAQESLTGFVTTSGAGSTQVGREQKESLEKTIRRILYSLYLRNPSAYPLQQAVNRTRTRYLLS